MFHRDAPGGGSVAFWEDSWRGADGVAADEFYDVDPLKGWFDRVVQPGTVVLEGGCGPARYVAALAARGVSALGLDFAVGTLKEVRGRHPSLALAAGDVARLPLGAGTIDVYFSGGVVEHFEAGPHAAIAEARRVLRPGGVLLISVPYFSPLRRVVVPFRRRRSEWQLAPVHGVSPSVAGRSFFQYAYRPEEFERILSVLGFAVLRRQGYSILWGLYEVPGVGAWLRAAAESFQRGGDNSGAQAGGPTAAPSQPRTAAVTLAKRLLVSEDDTVPVAGRVVAGLRWLAANMMLYECRPIS